MVGACCDDEITRDCTIEEFLFIEYGIGVRKHALTSRDPSPRIILHCGEIPEDE